MNETSARIDIEHRLHKVGFRPLVSTLDHRQVSTWYRWCGPIRQEVHLVFDDGGRLFSWSLWENVQRHIDGETGRRDRLNAYLDSQEGTAP